MKKTLAALILIWGALGGGDADANSEVALAHPAATAHLAERAQTNPPVGYVQFCEDFPADCVVTTAPRRVELTEASWRELVDVNDMVNQSITPVTDQELYGVPEYWTYPVTAGDCEEYVLLKRRVLIERGWPASALLITVVRDEAGDGHAVLTVTTSAGDLVLDNQHAEIRLWHDTPYEYLKRQSAANANAWVSLGTPALHEMPVAGTGGH